LSYILAGNPPPTVLGPGPTAMGRVRDSSPRPAGRPASDSIVINRAFYGVRPDIGFLLNGHVASARSCRAEYSTHPAAPPARHAPPRQADCPLAIALSWRPPSDATDARTHSRPEVFFRFASLLHFQFFISKISPVCRASIVISRP